MTPMPGIKPESHDCSMNHDKKTIQNSAIVNQLSYRARLKCTIIIPFSNTFDNDLDGRGESRTR